MGIGPRHGFAPASEAVSGRFPRLHPCSCPLRVTLRYRSLRTPNDGEPILCAWWSSSAVRVLHVIPSYPPTTAYTGPPTALHRLCRELRGIGIDVRVATTNADGPCRLAVPNSRWIEYEGVPVFYGNRWGGRGDLSPALHACIQEEVQRVDLIHVAAIFSWPILSAARACRSIRKPLVVSPRGSFAAEALAWRAGKKKLFLAFGGQRALEAVTAFHATTPSEAQDIRRLFPRTGVGVVPNGVDVPSDAELAPWRAVANPRTILFLGRLHQHKNVDLLLRAWALVAPKFKDVSLLVAGSGSGKMLEAMKRLVADLGTTRQVSFLGNVQGDEKTRLLAQADVLVLPSKSENFGNVVAEALAHGTPVIASTGTPWRGLGEKGCGWWVRAAEAPLGRALETVLAMDSERRQEMGQSGREWMRREYSWTEVAASMREFYGEVLERS